MLPAPLSVMTPGLRWSLEVMTIEELYGPEPDGVKDAKSVQPLPGANLSEQFRLKAKLSPFPPDTVASTICNALVPVFVSTIARRVLVKPTAWTPKSKDAGQSLIMGVDFGLELRRVRIRPAWTPRTERPKTIPIAHRPKRATNKPR